MVVFSLLFACNGENIPDCFQNAGDIIEQEFVVDAFTTITVNPRIELIITDAPTQKVIVQTGEFLMPDIEVRVENGRLLLFNDNVCNLTRDYGITKVFVSAPNLTEIRNGSSLTVSSNGVLTYDELRLVSEDFNDEDALNTTGNFDIEVNSETINIVVNNLSTVYMSGSVESIFVGYYSGDARFEGRNLMAQDVEIYQRSSNDMIINPQQSITGEIRSTGDVILVNTPTVIDVQQFYTGQLIIE